MSTNAGSNADREAVLARMEAVKRIWADHDLSAADELEFRIIRKARDRGFLSYSELSHGVQFRLPNLNGGRPYEIDIHSWKDSDRALIGDFLGLISTRSFRDHGFMLSAVVVGKDISQPSPHFFDWMKKLGMLEDLNEDTVLRFWKKQFKAVFDHYCRR